MPLHAGGGEPTAVIRPTTIRSALSMFSRIVTLWSGMSARVVRSAAPPSRGINANNIIAAVDNRVLVRAIGIIGAPDRVAGGVVSGEHLRGDGRLAALGAHRVLRVDTGLMRGP